MLTRAKLHPGEPGTRKLVAEYGEKLLSVRYVYDPESKKRYTTVELIVGEAPWDPFRWRVKPDTIVPVRIQWGERELAIKVREAGGTWDAQRKVWRLSYRQVVELNLEGRIQLSSGDEERLREKKGARHKLASTNR